MSDAPTLVRFYIGWEDTGEIENGLPQYRETVRIRMDRPPYLMVDREATEEEIEANPEPYRLFEKEQKARKTKPTTGGFPLVLWPAINDFYLKAFAAKDIVTVEQLAKLAKRKDMPPDFIELAERAAQMVTLMNSGAKYEPLIREKDGQIAALKEQVAECLTTISTQKAQIDSLKTRAA